MAWTIAAKILGSFLGGMAAWLPLSPVPAAACLGVLPVWFEVLAGKITKTEPGRESRRLWLWLDALVDSLSFLFFPVFFLWQFESTVAVKVAFGFFLLAGIFRIVRFLRTGLVEGCFVGLPVTYTGYACPVGVWLILQGFMWGAALLFILLAFLMVHPKIRIKSV